MFRNFRSIALGIAISSIAWALRPDFVYIVTPEEAREHQLPGLALELHSRWRLEKFPDPRTFLRSEPTPSEGCFSFSVGAYRGLPDSKEGLERLISKDFRAKQSIVHAPIKVAGGSFQAVSYITGASQARTAHLYFLIPLDSANEEGALVQCESGPYVAPQLKPDDFRFRVAGFSTLLDSLRVGPVPNAEPSAWPGPRAGR